MNHVEPKTTRCIKGHLRTPANIYVAPKTGIIGCRECIRTRTKRYRLDHLEEARRGSARRSVKSRFGGNREIAIQRDGEKCVKCGMTRQQHRAKFGCDISVDHINNLGRYKSAAQRDNRVENLQTLCLPCHSSKDFRGIKTKLTHSQYINIQHCKGSISAKRLGPLYGVSRETVRLIWVGVSKESSYLHHQEAGEAAEGSAA